MIENSNLVGVTAAHLMESLEIEQRDDDAKVIEVLVAVLCEDVDENGQESTFVRYRFSDAYWTHQLGFIEALRKAMSNGRTTQIDTDDEEDTEDE